jgi:alkanesulfonate monooxygenase SsuD/methylene tetrahydromethanopterin reductase-like flavin-dependent oxidoreductase (luciferase family)
VIGGTKGKAFERTARFGNGWFAPTASPEQLAPLIEQLEKACADVGRDPAEIKVTAMWFPNTDDLSDVEKYADMGVHRLVVPLPALGKGNPVENLGAFGENVLSKIG